MDIKETRELVQFVAGLIKSIKLANGDGEFTWSDSVHFMSLMPLAGKAISGINSVKDEVKDLDEAEIKELKDIITDALEIDEDLDNVVEMVLSVALNIVKMVKASRAKK